MNELEELYKKMKSDMERNHLFANRTLVCGLGIKKPEIIFVGEAPGKDEEIQGKPFVGKAGKNLTTFLKVLEVERHEIFITNLVKIRPCRASPKTGNFINRPPNKDEIDFFTPYVLKEIEILSPRFIVTLGNVALKAITNERSIKIGDVNGKLIRKGKFHIFPLYHPASVIYNQALVPVFNQNLLTLKELIKEKRY